MWRIKDQHVDPYHTGGVFYYPGCMQNTIKVHSVIIKSISQNMDYLVQTKDIDRSKLSVDGDWQ